jgi:hypothetical protein
MKYIPKVFAGITQTMTVQPTYVTVNPTTSASTTYYSTGEGSFCPPGQCYVHSYYRKDGTYVSGYCRRC